MRYTVHAYVTLFLLCEPHPFSTGGCADLVDDDPTARRVEVECVEGRQQREHLFCTCDKPLPHN
jgi:hypothetical protein